MSKVKPPCRGVKRSCVILAPQALSLGSRWAGGSRYCVTTVMLHDRLVQFFMPTTRPQDNVPISVQEPQEDEFAFAALTGRNPTIGWAFPRRAEFYNRYLTLRELPESEVAQWKSALKLFLQKLSCKYKRPLVLKSPGHTCRIRLLLELFPNARFVHIHRNPYDVFQSTQHLV